ncbi:MAG: tetratricopeptide repeat protein [Candidatus Hodarchaeota archaeon]
MANPEPRELTQAEQLINKGQFEEALNILESFDQYGELTSSNRVKSHLLKSQIKIKLGNYLESLEFAKSCLKKAKKLENPNYIVEAMESQAEALYYLGRFNEGLDIIREGEQLLDPLLVQKHPDLVRRKASLLNVKGKIFEKKGDEDSALECYWESAALYEELKDNGYISAVLNNIGIIYRKKGDLDKALDYYQQSLELREEIGNKIDIVASLNNIGIIYGFKGKLDRALEHYQQALSIMKDIGNKQYIAAIINNIGNIFFDKGELDQALENYKQSMALWEELGHQQYIAYCINHLGKIYRRKGELDRALGYYQEALSILEEIKNNFDTSITLFDLISTALDNNALHLAQKYLESLKDINDKEKNKVIDQRYRVAEALIMKKNPRARMRVKAEDLLEQVTREEIIDHEITIAAMLNFCDLLLGELRVSNDPEILKEVQTKVLDLLEIAKQQHSHWLLAETYFLRAKLFLLELDVESARQYLFQAQLIAEERGMQTLAMKISHEHDLLLNQSRKWNELISKEASLAERMDLAEMQGTVERIVQMKMVDIPELQKEEPVLFLIVAQNGLSVFSKPFIPEGEVNSQLLGAFLSAINTFSDAVFSRSLDRVRLGEFTLVMKSQDPLLMCYVFKGQAFSAIQKLNHFSKIAVESTLEWSALLRTNETGITLNPSEHGSLERITEKVFLSN